VVVVNKEIWAPRKESQSSIPLKLLLKKSTMENSQKLQLTVKEFAILAMAWAVKQELCKNAPPVRVVVWSQKCKCSDLECTLSLKALVMIAEERERSLTKRINVKTAMERKLRKKRNYSRLKSIRDHQTAANTPSTVKLMNTQVLKLEMSL